ncbi:DUF2917 domain-containing protein [Roseateles saccharophilus]|uniref:DUF2917 family protein n=1 Tax=Roseateles saccharophilus TaxID=304 RepID=A0A4R3UZA3_ROSSA|nr:DUF2917 domain-containing protein [Roseateles saccharophilus]MDG0835342.1 DUF2917 domain-containing protein [Roseateles saccharophilus]TCU96147.1 DUF2917 family protein [Roseateles saccharophilus]
MSDRFTTLLGPGQAMTLAAVPAPRRLVVTSGRLWLTISGGTVDHWLGAGEGLTVAAGQEVVAEGWPQAEFQLLQPLPTRRAVARPARGWRMNLAGQGA